jgi:hypothetical protein
MGRACVGDGNPRSKANRLSLFAAPFAIDIQCLPSPRVGCSRPRGELFTATKSRSSTIGKNRAIIAAAAQFTPTFADKQTSDNWQLSKSWLRPFSRMIRFPAAPFSVVSSLAANIRSDATTKNAAAAEKHSRRVRFCDTSEGINEPTGSAVAFRAKNPGSRKTDVPM